MTGFQLPNSINIKIIETESLPVKKETILLLILPSIKYNDFGLKTNLIILFS